MKSVSCSWCHTINPTTLARCRECGHQVGVPRMDCLCQTCHPAEPDLEALRRQPPGEVPPLSAADVRWQQTTARRLREAMLQCELWHDPQRALLVLRRDIRTIAAELEKATLPAEQRADVIGFDEHGREHELSAVERMRKMAAELKNDGPKLA